MIANEAQSVESTEWIAFSLVILMMLQNNFLFVRSNVDMHTFVNRIFNETLAGDIPCVDVLKPVKTYGDITCFPVALRTDSYSWLLLTELCYHTQIYHSRQDFSGRVISPTRLSVPDNTQHSQQTDIHVLCGIRSHNPSKKATHLRRRGDWDW